MSRYKAYPAYKDSGIDWIGELPKNWEVKPVYSLGILRNGYPFDSAQFDKEGVSENRLIRIRDLLNEKNRTFTSEPCPVGATIKNGDVLVGMDGDFNVRQWHAGKAKLNQRVCSLRGDTKELTRYLSYCLPIQLKVINDLSHVTTVKHLSSYEVRHSRIPLPPADELSKVVTTLDCETNRIDILISKKTRFIELLREKRQAMITHAVTKGLDSDVPMKDSEVEWLGEVPAHWDVCRIGTIYREVVRTGEAGLPVLSISIHDGITDDQLEAGDRARRVDLIEDRTQYQKVGRGDLAYNMMRAWQGGFGAVQVDGLVSPAYVVVEPVAEVASDYVVKLLRTSMAIEEMRRFSKGIADFRQRLYWEHFRDIRLCLPPISEQRRIIDYIRRHAQRIGKLVQKTERSIELLKEKRSALITAAVTGKIDVRDTAQEAA